MNSTTTTTNADGSITTVIYVNSHRVTHYSMIALAALAAILIVAGLYLLLRKKN